MRKNMEKITKLERRLERQALGRYELLKIALCLPKGTVLGSPINLRLCSEKLRAIIGERSRGLSPHPLRLYSYCTDGAFSRRSLIDMAKALTKRKGLPDTYGEVLNLARQHAGRKDNSVHKNICLGKGTKIAKKVFLAYEDELLDMAIKHRGLKNTSSKKKKVVTPRQNPLLPGFEDKPHKVGISTILNEQEKICRAVGVAMDAFFDAIRAEK